MDSHGSADSPQAVRRILSIDGGGIMGTAPAAFLASIEEQLEHPIGRYFDLIAGTSTGGIIAIGLGLGLTAKELLKFYEERGPEIFDQERHGIAGWLTRSGRALRQLVAPKHDESRLRAVLADVLGDRRLGEASTRLLVPAWNPDRREVYIYKTAHHGRLMTDYRQTALDAAMATAAAPTFFRRHVTAQGVGLVDGGVWANNPVGLAAVEAITLLGWPADRLQILSLGCVNEIYALGEAPGISQIAADLTRLFGSGQSHGALGTAKLISGHEHERQCLHRIEHNVPKDLFRLDDTSRIERLKGLGVSCARDRAPVLMPIFFDAPAAPFVPHYSLTEVRP